MSTQPIKLQFAQSPEGFFPIINAFDEAEQKRQFIIHSPLRIALKDYGTHQGQYQNLSCSGQQITARGIIEASEGSVFEFQDRWYVTDKNTIQVDRNIKVKAKGKSEGIRSVLQLTTAFDSGAQIGDFAFFAPANFYGDNDIDGDGVPDFLKTYNLSFREDRLTVPASMGYHNQGKFYIALIRADLPEYDPPLKRKPRERFFIQDTDVGSLGFSPQTEGKRNQIVFQAHYPFYEGESTYALSRNLESWGAFYPNSEDDELNMSYQIRFGVASSFTDAIWDLNKYAIKLFTPKPAELPFSLSESIDYRIQRLNNCYREWSKEDDPREPAGFIEYCYPPTGEPIWSENYIEFGPCGRNLGIAWAFLKYGYEKGESNYLDKARKVVNFFISSCQQENGFFYPIYNVDKKIFQSGHYGATVPINIAKDEEDLKKHLQKMKMKPWHIETIRGVERRKFNWLRSFGEEQVALLFCYEIEKQHGNEHPEWLTAAEKGADFLLKVQNDDGSWHHAYDVDGNPRTEPEEWFGSSEHEWKSQTAVVIPFLVKLHKLTGKSQYLDAAVRAGDFVTKNYVDRTGCCGGLNDLCMNMASIVRKNVPNSHFGAGMPLEGLLDLYKSTKEQRFLQAAVKAGIKLTTWVWVWDVPLPKGSFLEKYGFRSTGTGVLVPPFTWGNMEKMYWLRELLELAEITKDKHFFTYAKIMAFGMQQLLANPHNLYGYASVGIQAEANFLCYGLIDEYEQWTDGSSETKIGGLTRGVEKGMPNEICWSWQSAVCLMGLYKVKDKYGTIDFDKIYEKIWGVPLSLDRSG